MCALLSSSGGAAAAVTAATTGPIACNEPMYVIKRDGRKEKVQLDKITKRITAICILYDKKYIDPFAITIPVVAGLYCGVHTSELDSLAAEVAAALVTQHPDYSKIAARILMSNLHKKTENKFSYAIDRLFHAVDPVTKKPAPIISQYHYRIIMENAEVLNNAIVMDRDFDFTYFGLKTLEKSYLLRVNGQIIERPQYLFMRVAIGIHGPNIADAIDTYNWMSLKHFIHATPTLFAAATVRPQLSSCFLLTMQSDSLEGIFDTIKQCGMISKGSGGIGLNLHCIRARGSPISGGGAANGLVPLIRVLNNVARYVDQGGGKRPGAFAVYIEPWHADIIEFLELKRNTGKDEIRARELFYALWIPDLFMKRVLADDVWSLMCPYKCPNLDEVWGTEFETLYMQYEAEGRANSTIPARQLWMIIMQSQVETGMPFLLYKDACNRKSNHQHLGTIKSSNLCTEIIQYSSPEEVAVCNLASIAVNRFVRPEGTYDFRKLYDAVKVVTRNLNKVIDSTTYPVAEACTSNTKHRPIGIGIQGLADAFLLMRFPYESDEARLLNIQIFETLYYAALEASCELAQRDGPYSTYKGSPVSRGILQYDMWDITPTSLWNWNKLRSKINKYGVRNSLLIAPMPTASTAQILGNNESFEPYTSNVYSRRVLSGEYQVINNHLLNDLIKANLWDEDMKTQILANRGSIQNISRIPDAMKQLYKTVWEISVKRCILYAADRGPFIDQSQSFNLHVARPDYSLLTSIHTYSWKMGLKTGCYYIRILPAANAIQYTVDTSTKKQKPTTSTNINADGGIGNQRNTLTNRTHIATTKSIPFNKSVQFTSSSVSSVSSTDNDRASSNSSANLVTANGPITNNNNSNNNNIDSSYISSRIYESADILSSGSAQYKSIEISGSNGCESTDTTNNNSSSSNSNNCNRKPKKISINVPMPPPPPSSVSSSSSLSLSSPLSMSSLSSSTSSVSMLGIVPPSIPIMQCGLNPEDCLSCGS